MTNIQEIVDKGELFDGHYKLLHPLSTDGATADVWLALDTNTIDTEYEEDGSIINGKAEETGMLVAIKIYRPKNALDIEGEQRFRDEYKIVYECRHENLLQPTSFAIFQDIPYLVLPYCKNGSSEQLIGKKLATDEIWRLISDVASGLAKLHSNNPQIIHQDIKPANILIDNNHNYAITDFGISSKTNGIHGGYYDDENSGTFAYMAPERFGDNPVPIPESDIWAFGATLCEILTGKVPFGEDGGKSQDAHTAMPSLLGLPSSIKNLIHDCLQNDPKKRPSARQIMKAAQARQYPLKRKTPLIITIVLMVCLLIAGAVYFLFPPQKSLPVVSTEETFKNALRQMNINNIDSLNYGLKHMDTLSKKKYVPAMYQIIFTNGWYSDPISVQRKKLLGIKVDANNFPKEESVITKTRALMIDILEQNDTSNAYINADVAYRLASYYGDARLHDNDESKVDIYNANLYLDISEKWAIIAYDTTMLKNIQKTREKMLKKREQE